MTETSLIFQDPTNQPNIKDYLLESLENDSFDGLRVMVATISDSGLEPFTSKLRAFCSKGNSINFFIGTKMGPDPAAIRRLQGIQDEWPNLVNIQLVQIRTGNGLFHPKLYWLHGNKQHRIVVGSSNWSTRGFTSNVEAATCTDFSAPPSEPPTILQDLSETWIRIHESCTDNSGWGVLLEPSEQVLTELEAHWDSNQEIKEQSWDIELQENRETGVWPLQGRKPKLVMDLTMEQGGDRISQVQPPLSVWRGFFDIEPEGQQPEYILEDSRTGDIFQFPVVGHDHNWTIEIPGARVPRPAVIVIRREEERKLVYGVYTSRDNEFEEIDGFLSDEGEIPHHQQDRRQYISIS